MIAVSKLTLPVARKHLAELQKREFALRHASGALEYDAETLAPPGNRIARAQTLGMLGSASLELISSAEGIRLLDYLADHMDALSQPERRSVHLLRRSGEILSTSTNDKSPRAKEPASSSWLGNSNRPLRTQFINIVLFSKIKEYIE